MPIFALMKIALLSTFYPYRGGIAQFSARLYRELETDNEVKAFTFKRQYPSFLFPGKTQFVESGDIADPIPAVRVLDSTNPLSFSRTAREINRFEPDVLISQYWMTFFGPAIGSVHKKVGTAKRVSIVHNMIPHEKRFFDKPANKHFLKHNDGFVVLSKAVRDDLLSLKPDAKYVLIDHPLYDQFGELKERTEMLKQLGLDSDKKYLLFFGFIREYKGLDLLLEALSGLDNSYHLIVAGEVYGSFDKYQQLIDQYELADRVHLFNDYIPDDEVTNYFSIADVCVLPYKGATQSGITAVSHHFEVPIIATDVGGLKETIHHGKTGLIVDGPEPELIKNAIDQYFAEDMKGAFSENIRFEKAERSWPKFTEKVLDFVKTL